MINLYSKDATTFNNNGEATLTPIECFFSAAINGVWQLEMTLPFDEDGRYNLIENDKIIKVTGIDAIDEQTSSYQLFRIYDYKKQMDSTVYVLAYPVGLDARFDTYVFNLKSYDKTPAQAIAQLNNLSDKYTVTTDDASSGTRSGEWNNANLISILNGDDSYVSIWGGEICYDNYNIKVKTSLGRATGASEIRYGKNITGMSFEEDISEVITRLYPTAKSGERLNAIAEYKIANTQYVDAYNASDYPFPHISSIVAPYNLTQLSDDGSEEYEASKDAYDGIMMDVAEWLYNALTGVNATALLGANFELGWLLDNYALTMINDGVEGVVEYFWNKIRRDSTYGLKASGVQSLVYNAIKAGFDLVLKNDESPYYVGEAKKKMHQISGTNKYFYSYTWDTAGDYKVKSQASGQYIWVYANSKWNQINYSGETTGATDSATWKWYKVSGKSFKRYGNKKKKRYLKGQWWEISDVWYSFDNDGEGDKGATLRNNMIYLLDNWQVNGKTFFQEFAPMCKAVDRVLVELLYTQMTDYCEAILIGDNLSYPTPNITVDMVDLSKTTEYANYQGLLKVKLGDTVKCINTILEIATDLRVTGVTYDVLRGFNSQIQIGLTEAVFINKFNELGKVKTVESESYTAGDGIMIENNVISAVGQKITDVIVNGESVKVGGRAIIDIDALSGEGLQWFEETEDALFGYSTELALIDDNAYKTATAGNTITMSSSQTGETLDVAVSGDDSTLLIYYPYAYSSKASNIISGINVGNYGNALILSKSSFSVLTTMHPNPQSANPTVYSSFTSSSSDGWQAGYIINPDTGQHEYGWNGPIIFHGNAQVNGETWYMVMIGYNYQFTMSNTNRSLINYLPVAQYPNGDVTDDAAYETVAELIQATVPLTRSTEGGSFNGISREGNLAFFAGADDEHGLNAPIKIYKDGTYEGLDKVEDVKVDGTSVVTSKIANINTMTGATSGSSGTKGLVPRPLSADREKYLKGDGTWSTPSGGSDMQGATAQADGVHGLVPKPLIANREQFLKGDGTWATPTDTQYSDYDGSTHGLVPAPQSGDSGYLKVDGTWDEPEGTTVVANPSGTATADLTKLQVGTDIYSIPSGGGSGVDLSLEDNWDLFTNAPSYTSHTLVAGDKIKGVWSINKTSLRDSDRHTATDRALILQDFMVFARDSNANTVSLDVTVSGYGDVNTAMDVYYIATNNTSTDVAEIAYGVFFRSPKAGSGGGGGASALDDLTDVDLTSPTDGQVLKYNSTSSKWVNANESGGGGGGINYSTTEQDTGLTWIDGRPVYQKTYYISSVAQGVSVLDGNFTATLYDHVWQTDIHWRYFDINIDIGNHGGTGGAIYIESYNNQGLYAVNSTGVDITDLYFTIRYTKTADL